MSEAKLDRLYSAIQYFAITVVGLASLSVTGVGGYRLGAGLYLLVHGLLSGKLRLVPSLYELSGGVLLLGLSFLVGRLCATALTVKLQERRAAVK